MKSKDYYKEIDSALKRYETGKYPTHKIGWITDRIAWCARWRHITGAQTSELCDRAIAVMPLAGLYDF